MGQDMKVPPSYPVSSVDHALQIATILQLEGHVTISAVASRLGIARSTAHRLLATLVYRDFAARDEDRGYRVGPVLELAAHSSSEVSRVRAAALPHLRRLVDAVEESANVIIRTGETVRFVASVESRQTLRVGNREGMVFPAHRVSGGLVLLADLTDDRLLALYSSSQHTDHPHERPDLPRLRRELRTIRRQGFAVNPERAERGVVGVGCPVRRPDGSAVAGLSVSVPTVRHRPDDLLHLVGVIQESVRAIESDLLTASPTVLACRKGDSPHS